MELFQKVNINVLISKNIVANNKKYIDFNAILLYHQNRNTEKFVKYKNVYRERMVDIMSNFIKNINAYMSAKKIKNNYISVKTGYDASKLSRILNGKQPITEPEMKEISGALGHDCLYFMKDDLDFSSLEYNGTSVLCYAGNPTETQMATVRKLIDLSKKMESIINASSDFYEIVGVCEDES